MELREALCKSHPSYQSLRNRQTPLDISPGAHYGGGCSPHWAKTKACQQAVEGAQNKVTKRSVPRPKKVEDWWRS